MGRNQGLLAGVGRKLRLSGSASFRHTRQMLVPRRAGVYLLHDLRGVLYAGSTRNLYCRFHQHYWLTANNLIEQAMRQPFGELTFSWFLVADDHQRGALERVLIGWLRPHAIACFPLTT